MRPLTFINGVIFASATALAGVLGIILFFRYVMTLDISLDQTVVRSDLPLGLLVQDMLIFSGLALIAGAAFWGQLAGRHWRWLLEYLLALALGGVLIFFLAANGNRSRALALFALVAMLAAIIGMAAWYSGWLRRLWEWLEDDG